MTRRFGLALAGVIVVAGVSAWTLLRSGDSSPAGRPGIVARELNDSLIYLGIGLYQKKDYQGAAAAWQRYIAGAPPNADTVSVREMIQEAESAAAAASQTRRIRRTSSIIWPRAPQPEVLQPVAPRRSVRATVHRTDPRHKEVGA